jgi:fructokinase
MILIGLDVGGTKIEGHLYEFHPFKSDAPPFFLKVNAPDGRDYIIKILSQKRVPTEREKGYDHVLNNMKELCLELTKDLSKGLKSVSGIGVGLPGTVDPETQEMLNGNTSLFVDKDLIQDFQYALDSNLPIQLANDANCFALAEVMAGVGPRHFQLTGKKVMDQIGLGIILGTGVGGGIIYEGKALVGKKGDPVFVQPKGMRKITYQARHFYNLTERALRVNSIQTLLQKIFSRWQKMGTPWPTQP